MWFQIYGMHGIMMGTKWCAIVGEIMVNPYNFYSRVIESYILPKAEEGVNYNQSLSQLHHSFVDKPGYLGGDWIKKQLFIR